MHTTVSFSNAEETADFNSAPVIQQTVPWQNYMTCILTKWALEYQWKIPLSTLMSYFVDMNSACGTTSTVIPSTETPIVIVPTIPSIWNSRYPWCDMDDIVLPNGQVWAACNVGASKAGTGVESYGSLFQWGRNVPFSSTGSVSTIQWPVSANAAKLLTDFVVWINKFWLTPNDNNLWWGSGTTALVVSWVNSNNTEAIYSDLNSDNKKLMQGPCMEWYHIPTAKEWKNTIDTLNWTGFVVKTSEDKVWGKLLLPYAWYRMGANWQVTSGTFDGQLQWENQGSYWSSSIELIPYEWKIQESLYMLSMMPHYNIGLSSGIKYNMANFGYSIRCLKN